MLNSDPAQTQDLAYIFYIKLTKRLDLLQDYQEA